MKNFDSPELPDYIQIPRSEALLLKMEPQKGKILNDVAALFERSGIEDEVDQKIVREAIAFIENPTENLSDIMSHTTIIAQVLAGYMMQGADEPPEIDAIHAYLLALQCINRVKFVEEGFAQESPDFPEINKAANRGKDWAETLSKGYNDDAFYVSVLAAFLAAFGEFQDKLDNL
ncbi:hypothetical protein ACFLZH_03625 [Patescibacteria group bacterium]